MFQKSLDSELIVEDEKLSTLDQETENKYKRVTTFVTACKNAQLAGRCHMNKRAREETHRKGKMRGKTGHFHDGRSHGQPPEGGVCHDCEDGLENSNGTLAKSQP